MSSKGAGGPKKMPKTELADTVASLLRVVAEKERQLQDLTDQSIGFLEKLGESQRQIGEQTKLLTRLDDLQRALTDARQRLRGASSYAPFAADDPAAPVTPLEIVCFGPDTANSALAYAAAGIKLTWIGPPQTFTAHQKHKTSLRILTHREARTPAQCWNLAMASTQGEAVLFIGAGIQLDRALQSPDAATNSNAALLCPTIQCDEERTLGCAETDSLLHLRALPAPPPNGESTDIPFPSAQAFLLRRPAFERIGMFDEGLISVAALLDYACRARNHNFAVIGAPDLVLTRLSGCNAVAEASDNERLQVLARYRPEMIGRALADAPTLWQQEPTAIAGLLRELIAAIPNRQDAATLRQVMEQVACGMVEHAQPSRRIVRLIQTIRIELLRALSGTDVAFERELASASLFTAEREVPTSVAASFALLAQDLALDLRMRTFLLGNLQETQRQLQQEATNHKAHAQRAERSEREASDLNNQLVENEKKVIRIEQRLDWTGNLLANIQEQLEESRNLRSATEQKLAASGQKVADLQGQFDKSLRVQHESETKLQNLQLKLEESRNLRSATEQKLAASGQQVADLQGKFDAAKPIAVANGAKLDLATRQLAARQQELTDISCSLDLAQSARRDTESSLVIALQAVDEMTKTLAKAQAHLIDADAKVTATLAHAATQDEAFSRAHERVETAEKNARNAESDLLRVRSERELLQGAFDALQERLEVAARRQDITNQELAANGQRMLAADANLLLLQNDLTHAESALQKTKASASTMHGDLVALAHSVGLSEPPPPDRLRELLSMLHRDANLLATTLVATGAGDAASLVTKLQVTQQQLDTASDLLRERETWIRILLLQSTKIRLRRRQLMPHEQEFLTRVKP
ncbi:MAG: hypothetical protein EXS02_13225 [Planctomycetes bacterium]|nr:hypothetical protein [Planctomycetota bacterium]